jgi:hypothetical protein
VLIELITVESYWLTKEWIANCCLFNLDEKFISLYRNSLYNLIYWFFISWFIEISLRIEIFDRHETLFFWSRCLRASLSLRSDFIRIAYSSSSSLTSRRSRKSVNMKKIISTWINHLDWMIVKRLDSKSTYWWRNWRYESSQINRCDSWSNRSCMKNWMMIKSSDLLVFSEKTNSSGRSRSAISSTHLTTSTYHSTASPFYLSTAFFFFFAKIIFKYWESALLREKTIVMI